MTSHLGTKIVDMDFIVPPWDKRMSTRVRNKLLRNGIFTLEQLLELDRAARAHMLGIVENSIVGQKVKALGLKFKDQR